MDPSNQDFDLQMLVDRLLAFRQNPERWQRALRDQQGPVDNAGMIIRLALGRSPANAHTTPAANSNEVKHSASEYIARVFADESADHYRVLGVATDANADQIKEHFRLLMSLVHPDKAIDGFTWPATVATSVTRAYEVLINPYQRGLYDAQLAAQTQAKPTANQLGEKSKPTLRGRPGGGVRGPAAAASPGGMLQRWARRTAACLAGLVALGIVWFGIKYMIDPYSEGFLVGTKSSVDTPFDQAREPPPPPVMRLATTVSSPNADGERPAVREESRSLEVAPPSAIVGTPASAIPRVAESTASARANRGADESRATGTAIFTPTTQPVTEVLPAVKTPERAPTTVPSQSTQRVASAPATVEPATVTALEAPTATVSASVPDPVMISTAEADTITQLFLHSYDTGNLPAMARLFDGKEVGRQSFAWQRDDYARTFESSSQRRILVTSLQRQPEIFGFRARIEGELMMQLKSDATPNSRNIFIELDIIKRDGKAMIARVRHGLLNRP
jgi:hypothetical protein